MRRRGVFIALAMVLAASCSLTGPIVAAATGTPVEMNTPGPLAVTPTGVLFVASGRELFRLSGRRFVPVARAPEVIRSAVASSDGSIFVGEARLLQRVMPDGSVGTVAHMHVSGLGRGPHGTIYVVTNAAVSRVMGHEVVPVVRASQFAGLAHVPVEVSAIDFANVAVDASGNTYISAVGVGYSLFEITRGGRARYVAPARAGGGFPSSLTAGSDGRVYLGVQNSVLWVSNGRVGGFMSFPKGAIKGFSGAFAPTYLAASGAPGGPLYADAVNGNGFGNESGVITIYPGHRVVTLWVHK